MVTITYENGQGQENPSVRLEIEGHAGFGQPGQDLLCSALSILMHTAVKLVEEMENKGQLRYPPVLELSVGQGLVEFRPRASYYPTIQAQMDGVVTGLKLLAGYYPKYVTFQV